MINYDLKPTGRGLTQHMHAVRLDVFARTDQNNPTVHTVAICWRNR